MELIMMDAGELQNSVHGMGRCGFSRLRVIYVIAAGAVRERIPALHSALPPAQGFLVFGLAARQVGRFLASDRSACRMRRAAKTPNTSPPTGDNPDELGSFGENALPRLTR